MDRGLSDFSDVKSYGLSRLPLKHSIQKRRNKLPVDPITRLRCLRDFVRLERVAAV
jgi:hypothetical protein